MAGKSKAMKQRPGTALTRWEDRLAGKAQAAADEEVSGGRWISIRGGQLQYDGQSIKGNVLRVVVLGSLIENVYYGRDFDPDKPGAPLCFAFAHGREQQPAMAPHAAASKPQSATCATCQWNKFGTSKSGKGKGKACKNIRRLALLPAGDKLTPESAKTLDLAFLKVPVTSVPAWSNYVKGIAAMYKRPPYAMITEISVVPDKETQLKIIFTPVGPLGDEYADVIEERIETVKREIDFPYQGGSADEDEQPRGAAGDKKKRSKM